MTQVQTMTNPELNRALAELMGYSVEHYEGYARVMRNGEVQCAWLPDEGYTHAFMPDYCNSPAASLEVQTAAINADYKAYILNLGELVRKGRDTLDEMIMDLLTARPRERAEAAYITLSSKQ